MGNSIMLDFFFFTVRLAEIYTQEYREYKQKQTELEKQLEQKAHILFEQKTENHFQSPGKHVYVS